MIIQNKQSITSCPGNKVGLEVRGSFKKGVYTLKGSMGSDRIEIAKAKGRGNLVEIKVNGATVDVVPYEKIHSFHIEGGAGNDTITIDPSVVIDATVDDGDGYDRIFTNGQKGTYTGGAGKDKIDGAIVEGDKMVYKNPNPQYGLKA
ncbi:MAG: hypothetical protein HY541_02110 [Deltaproteobacteria bacterium]|nr:hypothetical protein [Deltaproteobacteria bacterium]